MRSLLRATTILAWAGAVWLAAPGLAAPRVRLLIAVPTADAYDQVMALVHDGRLTAMDGEAFVFVGDFADARQGHDLGLSLQRRLRLPFELVYESLHPQADLAWSPPGGKPLTPPPLPPLAQLPPLESNGVVEAKVPESLIYLYAEPQTADQESRLAHYLQQSKLFAEVDGVRVGVYRDTPKSLAASRQREAQLQALGIPVQRLRRAPGSSLATALPL